MLMNMESYNFYWYITASVAYFLMLPLLFLGFKKNPLTIQFAIPIFWSSLCAGVAAYAQLNMGQFFAGILPFETIRNASWFYLLGVLLSRQQYNNYLIFKHEISYLLMLWIVFTLMLEWFSYFRYMIQQIIGVDPRLIAHTSFAIIGMFLVELLYRNADAGQRWVIKFVCLSLGALFITDFIVYSKSLLFDKLDETLWHSRAIFSVLILPLLAISIYRFQFEKAKVGLSRRIVLYTSVLFGMGSYLILMSFIGFYIKIYGGSWGQIVQFVFIFLALLILATIFLSGKVKALAKVYLNKHFFRLRYDYREEWVKLCKAISKLDSPSELHGFIIKTMADLVDSSGGGVWISDDQGNFYLAEENNLGFQPMHLINSDHSLVQFLISTKWVIDFVEYRENQDIYNEVDLTPWNSKEQHVWLIIPLLRQDKMIAFVVLTQARVLRRLNWEDHDLLKTIGMQLAGALALNHASEALAKSRQFEVYSRFSAFLVHDLKNLVAQISLMIRNAKLYKHDPKFIDDSIATLENVVCKLDHILGQLKRGNVTYEDKTIFRLVDIAAEVEKQQAGNRPSLKVSSSHDEVYIAVEKTKMTAILGHLVQNAQDATDDNGSVELELGQEGHQAVIKIIDNGSGMDSKFIAERLFKPFDTTKGNAGMGIGVYEARDFILKNSGKFEVSSVPGEGSVFTITLPLAVPPLEN